MSIGVDLFVMFVLGIVVELGCCYFLELCFLESLMVGLVVMWLGCSSVIYWLGVFKEFDDVGVIIVFGYWVYVYVDWISCRLVLIFEVIWLLLLMVCVSG